jgi:hypothetical protein
MPAGHDLARGASRGAGAYSPHRFEAPARGRSSSPAASDVPVSGTAAEIMNYLREVRRGSPQPTRGSSSPLGSGGTPRTSTSTSTGRRGGGGGSGKSGSTLEKNTTTHASHGHAGAASGSCGGDDRALRRRSVALETEAHEQTRAVAALRDALKAERTRHAEALAALETNHATTVREIKAAHSVATDRQLSFADQLLRDKAELAARCDTLAAEVEQLRGDNTTMQAGACFLFEKKKTDVFFFFIFFLKFPFLKKKKKKNPFSPIHGINLAPSCGGGFGGAVECPADGDLGRRAAKAGSLGETQDDRDSRINGPGAGT